MAMRSVEPTDEPQEGGHDLIHELLVRVKCDDVEAFDRLYADLHALLQRQALRQGLTAEDAKDAVHDTLALVWQNRAKYDEARSGPGGGRAYVGRICHNVIADRFRRMKVRAAKPLDLENAEQCSSDEPSPNDEAVSAERRVLLNRALRRMSATEIELLTQLPKRGRPSKDFEAARTKFVDLVRSMCKGMEW